MDRRYRLVGAAHLIVMLIVLNIQALPGVALSLDAPPGTFGESSVVEDGTTLYPGLKFLVGVDSYAAAGGDLNGDGHLDVVTANSDSDDISVLLGRGDGTFAPQARFAAGYGPGSLAVTDLNGDGLPNLVTANSASSDVSVLVHR